MKKTNEFLVDVARLRPARLHELALMFGACASWSTTSETMTLALGRIGRALSAAARRKRRGAIRIRLPARLRTDEKVVLVGVLRRWAETFQKIEAVGCCLTVMAGAVEASVPAGEKKSRKRTTGGR